MLSNLTGDGSQRASPRLTDVMPRYPLAELARSDYSQAQSPEERDGLMRPP
jgi:hypothetical protein